MDAEVKLLNMTSNKRVDLLWCNLSCIILGLFNFHMRFVFSEEGYISTCWYIYLWIWLTLHILTSFFLFLFLTFLFSFLIGNIIHTHIWLNSWYDFHTVFMEAGNAFGLETIGILNHYHYPRPYNDWCYWQICQGASYCKCSRWKKWKQNKE